MQVSQAAARSCASKVLTALRTSRASSGASSLGSSSGCTCVGNKPKIRRLSQTKVCVVVRANQAADWPRLAEARGSLECAVALREASREPAGRRLSRLVCLQLGAA